MYFLRTVAFVAILLSATSAVEEQPPNGFYLGFVANLPGFHGFNNPNFPSPAADADSADTPGSPGVGTVQIDTNDGSGDDGITADALPERQELIDEGNEESDRKYVIEFRDSRAIKVECDFVTQPRFSCYSCFQYLECKGQEGKVNSCDNPLAPYCVNRICSPTPSMECA